MSFLKNLKRFLHANMLWLVSASPILRAFGITAVVFIVAWLLPGIADDRVKYAGMLFELLGIFTVAIGIRGKRKLFELPGLIKHAQNFWNARPRWKPKTQTISVSGISAGGAVGSARVTSWQNAVDVTFESRVLAIEANLERLRNQQEETIKNIDNERQSREKALAGERQLRELAVMKIETQLDALAVDGINLETAGIFWLVLGLILATIPTEIVAIFNCLF